MRKIDKVTQKHISIKKDKKELLFNLKRKKYHRLSKVLQNREPMLSNKLVSSEKITLDENEDYLLLMTRRLQNF